MMCVVLAVVCVAAAVVITALIVQDQYVGMAEAYDRKLADLEKELEEYRK